MRGKNNGEKNATKYIRVEKRGHKNVQRRGANKDKCKENSLCWKGRRKKEDIQYSNAYVLNVIALSIPQSIQAHYVYTALKKSQKEIEKEFSALAFLDFLRADKCC